MYSQPLSNTNKIYNGERPTKVINIAQPNNEQRENIHYRFFLHKITWICTLGGLLFGYDTGVINGALPYMRNDLKLSDVKIGIVTSSLLIGATFGSFIGGHLADWIGRRKTLIILSIIFIIGTIGCSLSNLNFLIFFRFILGLAVGGASTTVPVFLAELSPAKLRGQVVTRNELMIVSGQLVAYICNAILGNIWGHRLDIWRWMLALAVIPAICLLIGILFGGIPESPRWLCHKGKNELAISVLKKIRRNEQEVFDEIGDVKQTMEQEQNKTFSNCLHERWLRRCLFIGIGVAMCNQLAGVNSIMYFGTDILTRSGLDNNAALVANIANGVISVLATCLGIWLLGRIGRRPMLLSGQIGTIVMHLFIGTTALLFKEGTIRGYLVLSLTVTFLLFQQGGISPVTWLVQSEMFPLKIRGLAMGLTTSILWLINCLISFLFPVLVGLINVWGTSYLFVIIGVSAAIFVWFFMPETRLKSLEELERQFRAENLKELRSPAKNGITSNNIRQNT
uniref:Major facilitator superfamily (MFS) profile domain-containing protein n=1 Tax=Meloidogyne enterolobii TaxID=390850 RepID=A0A6V7V5Q1_MELEN|nr:unnamed protein product [Meloidogyne enterolobii]